MAPRGAGEPCKLKSPLGLRQQPYIHLTNGNHHRLQEGTPGTVDTNEKTLKKSLDCGRMKFKSWQAKEILVL